MQNGILVIDDDPQFLFRMRSLLGAAGYSVIEADSGESGLAALDRLRDSIRLVIVDLVLPGLSGFEVIGAVKEQAPQTRVIATSKQLRHPYFEIAERIGAATAVEKPADKEPYPKYFWLNRIKRLLPANRGPATI